MSENRKISWYDIIRLFNSKYDDSFLRKNAKAHFDYLQVSVDGAKEKWKHLLALDAILCYCFNRLPREKRQFDHHDILRSCVIAIRNKSLATNKKSSFRNKITPLCYYSTNGFLNVHYRVDANNPNLTAADMDEDGNENYRPRLTTAISGIKDQVDAIGIILNASYPREIFDPLKFNPMKLSLVNPTEGFLSEIHFPWLNIDVFRKYAEDFTTNSKLQPTRHKIISTYCELKEVQGDSGLIKLLNEYISKVIEDEMALAEAQEQQQLLLQQQQILLPGISTVAHASPNGTNGVTHTSPMTLPAPPGLSPSNVAGTIPPKSLPLTGGPLLSGKSTLPTMSAPIGSLPSAPLLSSYSGAGSYVPLPTMHPPTQYPAMVNSTTKPMTTTQSSYNPLLAQSSFINNYVDLSAPYDDYPSYGDYSMPSYAPSYNMMGQSQPSPSTLFQPRQGHMPHVKYGQGNNSVPANTKIRTTNINQPLSQFVQPKVLVNPYNTMKPMMPAVSSNNMSAANMPLYKSLATGNVQLSEKLAKTDALPIPTTVSPQNAPVVTKYSERLKMLENLFKAITSKDYAHTAVAQMEITEVVPATCLMHSYQLNETQTFGTWCHPGKVIAVYDNGIGPGTSSAIVLAVSAYNADQAPLRRNKTIVSTDGQKSVKRVRKYDTNKSETSATTDDTDNLQDDYEPENVTFEQLNFVFSGVVPILLSDSEELGKFRRSVRNELIYVDENGFVGVWDRVTPGLRIFAVGLRQCTMFDEDGIPQLTNGIPGIKCLMLHQVESEGLRVQLCQLTNQLHSSQIALQQLSEVVRRQQELLEAHTQLLQAHAKHLNIPMPEDEGEPYWPTNSTAEKTTEDDVKSVSLASESDEEVEKAAPKRRGRPPSKKNAPPQVDEESEPESPPVSPKTSRLNRRAVAKAGAALEHNIIQFALSSSNSNNNNNQRKSFGGSSSRNADKRKRSSY